MRLLKQSTQVVKLIGPFLDKGDGVTEEAGLAGAGTEISKEGAAFGAGPVLGTYDSDGWYPITLTTTHTNTVGDLTIKVHDAATHLPVWVHFTVVSANVWDSLVGGTDTLQADVTQLLGTAWLTPGTAGTPDVNTKLAGGTAWGSGAITAGAIASGAITPAKVGAGTFTFDALAITGGAIFGSLAVNTTTTLTGNVSLGGTLGVTGTTTLAALTTTGTTTLNALTVSNATTLSGAVSLGSTLGIAGTTTLAAVTTTGTVTLNALTVSGATTLTGTVAFGSTWTIADSITWSGADWIISGTTDMREGISFKRTGNRAAINIYGSTNATTRGAVYMLAQAAGVPLIEVETTTNGNLFLATGLGSGKFLPDNVLTAAAAASDLGTELGTAVWATTTRVLTAGTNIQLPSNGLDNVTLPANIITATSIASNAFTDAKFATGEFAKVYTSTMTEAYGTDGAEFTLAQGMYQLWSRLSEFSISGTTLTAKKLDGTTSAFVLTLDSSTAPTAAARTS